MKLVAYRPGNLGPIMVVDGDIIEFDLSCVEDEVKVFLRVLMLSYLHSLAVVTFSQTLLGVKRKKKQVYARLLARAEEVVFSEFAESAVKPLDPTVYGVFAANDWWVSAWRDV